MIGSFNSTAVVMVLVWPLLILEIFKQGSKMNSYLLRIFCLIMFCTLYGCSSGSSSDDASESPKITVSGQAEKGPFLKRSEVTYHYINEEGETLSEDFSTETTDDMGSFSLALNDPGLIEIRVSGYHYDEINNQISDGVLTLKGLYIADDEETQAARVNLLTHIIHDRVLRLMADENLSAGLAVTQAEQELLAELEAVIPKVGVNDFSQLSVYNRENTNESGNAYLLLLSAALYQHSMNITPQGSSLSGQLTGVLNALIDDFEDGALAVSGPLIDGLAVAIQQLDSVDIASNLEDRSNEVLGESLGVPDFTGFILITYPAEGAILSEATPVRLEVPSGLQNPTLDLMVDGLLVDSITETPYEFTWDPYYWSSNSTSRHTLMVKARDESGEEVISNLVTVSVLPTSNSQLSLTSPSDNQIVENSDSLSLQWALYEGAAQYKVQVADTSSFTSLLFETTTSGGQFDLTGLDVGSYYWRIQAVDSEERAGAWSESIAFLIQAPQAPELQMPSFGTVVRNTATPTLSWSAVEGAASYQVQISYHNDFSSLITEEILTSESFTTSALTAGNYFWRVRSIDGVGHESNFSSTNAFIVSGSLPPEGITSEWSRGDSNYDVTLNWEAAEFASSYEIQVAADSSFINAVTNISVVLESETTGLAVGEYFARVRSINSDSVIGDWSDMFTVEVGLFQTQLGGSRDDRAKDIVRSRDGGYIVLAYTKSTEVSETVDSQGDDWIIKLSEQGIVEWQYISSAGGRDRFNDVIELSDGSIVAVGQDWDSDKAVAMKLDSNGQNQWEILYRPDGVAERYDFIDVVEFNNKLYVSSAEWGNSCGNSCTSRDNFYLHTISIDGTNVSDIINIPELTGLEIRSVDELEVSSGGNLLIAGTVLSGSSEPSSVGAYLQVLSSDLAQETTWNNMGEYLHESLGDVVELSNGKYVVIGTVFGSSSISAIHSEGSDSKNIETYDEYYSSESIDSGMNGAVYGLFQDRNVYSYPHPLTFMAFNSNLILTHQSYLLDLKEYVSSAGLVRNDDASFTLLINEGQDGSSNYDIIVTKRDMEL